MISNLERQLAGFTGEMASIKSEKSALEKTAADLRHQIESLERELRQTTADLQRSQLREEAVKGQLAQVQERVQDWKEEVTMLKHEKEKLFGKLDHLLFDNESLRNEVFMVKKMMLSIEKREMQGGYAPTSRELLLDLERPERNRLVDSEIEEMRRRPDTAK